MALQRINWTQIETENVTPGTTVDLGSSNAPLNAVYAENLYVSGTSLSDLVAGSSGSSGSNGSSGTSGSNGSSGTSGARGTSGTSGSSGTSSNGTSGSSGTSGENGVNGTSGTSGSSGFGSSGTSGSSGQSGSSGTSGARGSSGTSGSSGSSGTSGSSGSSGTSGANGLDGQNGQNGSSGTSGIDGSSGTSGINGSSGTSGINGLNGSSGTSGISGNNGSSGTSGTSGARGTSGTSGTSGNIYKTSSSTYVTDIDEHLGEDIPFTVDSGLSYTIGQVAIAATDVDNYLIGRVVSYSGTTLTLRIIDFLGGSGHDSWSINLYSAISGGGEGTSTPLSVTDNTITVNGVDKITFNGASVTNNTNGDVTVTIVGGGGGGTNGTSGSNGSSGTSGTSGIAGSGGSSGTSGSSGSSGTSGSSGLQGIQGTGGTSGTSGTSAEGGATGVYVIKLEYSAGSLIASPFVAAQDPEGNSLIGASGWSFVANGASEITVTHPLGVWLTNFMTHSQQSDTTKYLSRNMGGTATNQSVCVQSTNKDTMNFKALGSTTTGLNGTATKYQYITFQLPTNDFYI